MFDALDKFSREKLKKRRRLVKATDLSAISIREPAAQAPPPPPALSTKLKRKVMDLAPSDFDKDVVLVTKKSDPNSGKLSLH